MDFDVAVTILRLVAASVFLAHGLQKLVGWFGGSGIAGTTGFMQSLGFKPARLHAIASALSETGAGVLLLLGLLMPLAALLLLAVMFTAVASVHFSHGFFGGNGGYEFNLTLMAIGLALACVGPGWLSLDQLFSIDLFGWEWALGALVLAAVGAGGALATREQPQAAPAEGGAEA